MWLLLPLLPSVEQTTLKGPNEFFTAQSTGVKARHDKFQSAAPAQQRYSQAFWMLSRFDDSMSTQLFTVSLLIQIKCCQLAVQPSASSCLEESTLCPLCVGFVSCKNQAPSGTGSLSIRIRPGVLSQTAFQRQEGYCVSRRESTFPTGHPYAQSRQLET